MMHWLPVFFYQHRSMESRVVSTLVLDILPSKTHLQTYESTFMPYGVSTAAYLGDVFFRITRDLVHW